MQPAPSTDRRVTWAYWIACGLAVAGAIAPIALAHGSYSRVTSTLIPYGVAAALMAANALFHERGRPASTILFFAAGLAIVYGILAMISVPLRLAVVGTCPGPPAHCAPGLEQNLHVYESNSVAASVTFGVFAIASGFVGLMLLFRRRPPA